MKANIVRGKVTKSRSEQGALVFVTGRDMEETVTCCFCHIFPFLFLPFLHFLIFFPYNSSHYHRFILVVICVIVREYVPAKYVCFCKKIGVYLISLFMGQIGSSS